MNAGKALSFNTKRMGNTRISHKMHLIKRFPSQHSGWQNVDSSRLSTAMKPLETAKMNFRISTDGGTYFECARYINISNYTGQSMQEKS